MSLITEQKKFTVYDAWERFGITEHVGGIYATLRLIRLCNITSDQYILDIGCGTGYTAYLLAKNYQVNVVAADINSKALEETKKRIIKEDVVDKVKVIKADAHRLHFPSNTFDAVIAESVLVFCDKMKASTEAYRVLKPGGVFGDNELTYLKPPPDQLTSLIKSIFGIDIQPLQEDEWRAVHREAGFKDTSSTVYPINLTEQFLSHLRVDGIRKYVSTFIQSIFYPTIRVKRDVLQALHRFSSYVGYGLYVSRKV